MSIWHNIPLPHPLITESSGDEFRVSVPEGPSAAFVPISVSSLTRRSVPEVIERAVGLDGATALDDELQAGRGPL